MSISIESIRLFRQDLNTRMPFKYGIAVMTELPHIIMEVDVDFGGSKATGLSADHLPPKWFTKDPDKDPLVEIDDMLAVIEQAATKALTIEADTPFAFWLALYQAQKAWSEQENIPPLLAQFGTTFIERALIDAFCKHEKTTFATAVRENTLGIELGHIHASLEGWQPNQLLPAEPPEQLDLRHTVGLLDPLKEQDMNPEERIDDGLPESLEENIETYQLRQFKIKVNGNLETDIQRLKDIAEVVTQQTSDYAFSLDGNEQFKDVASFKSFWEAINESDEMKAFFSHLIFVEQPFHRDIALSPSIGSALKTWADRPTIIIDESDGEIESLPTAIACGYQGTSHKNCKGVFRGLANRCLINALNNKEGTNRYMMSGEDLANIGPVALLQDLVVQATLGNTSVERNGHHYFKGLSGFDENLQASVQQSHPDIYKKTEDDGVTLKVEEGQLSITSLLKAPFATGFELQWSKEPIKTWSRK